MSLSSRPLGVAVVTMGSTLLLLFVIGAVAATPMTELRAELDLEGYSTNLDNPKYRLLDTVQPLNINVDLDVFLSESRFDGLVQLEVDVTVSDLTQIVLHQKVVSIRTISVVNALNVPVALEVTNPFETDDYYEILIIHLASAIPAGIYTITISYLGQINGNPIDRGFYKGYYHDENNVLHEYATTQFQPYHARKAFPCFDEPQFKSRFVISITRDSTLRPSFSNMNISNTQTVANGRIRETFLPTPIVSAYLVAFHVSDFVATDHVGNVDKPFGIISRPNALNQHEFASDIGFVINEEFSTYFAIDYYEMGQGEIMKNDHIALPDFPSGAMENWGMVNYREAYLLYDEQNTNLPNQIFIATIIAHELAHKWFGNLVTCFWWSNLWLNESFASLFEYFAAHWADSSFEIGDQFVVDYVHSALNADSGAGATSMNWSVVADNPSISNHFSTTSYAKGASVLKMLEHFVGPFNFRTALRYYLRDNAYQVGTPIDMYNAFRRSLSEDRTFEYRYPGIDIESVFDSWVQNRGSPVLNVELNENNGVVSIDQERFVLTSVDDNPLWQVPVSWTSGANPNFQNTTPAFVMTTRTTTFTTTPGHHWIILNIAQSGLYRVNYDDHNWEMIAAALRTDRNVIHKLNRAQIVNDVLHFLRAYKISAVRAFDVLDFLKEETDYYVWAGALSQLDWFRRRFEHMPVAHEEFSKYMLNFMEAAIQSVGYEDRQGDPTNVILQRMQILNYACINLNHEGCVEYAKNRWEQYRATPSQLVPKNARRYVYCIGLREGDASDYNFLFQTYNASQNTADMVVILRTLACTKDESSINHYLEQSLYNNKIRIHDKTNAFSFALQANPENLPYVLNFVYTRYQDIITWYGGASRFNIALNGLTTYFTNFEDIVEFQIWLYENQLNLLQSFGTGRNVINNALSSLEWGNNLAVDVFVEARQRNSATVIITPITLLIVAIAAHLFNN